jgi:hypothetical protein
MDVFQNYDVDRPAGDPRSKGSTLTASEPAAGNGDARYGDRRLVQAALVDDRAGGYCFARVEQVGIVYFRDGEIWRAIDSSKKQL